MKTSTLCFCLKNDQVLLAMKKRGFGAGKWNGYGGKVKGSESLRKAAVRELKEESGLVTHEKNLEQVALVRFCFDEKPVFKCHVFLIREWQEEPKETEEMKPQWYPISQLPFKEMWVADVKWVPLVLAGEKIKVEVNFNADGSAVKEFSYKPAEFD